MLLEQLKFLSKKVEKAQTVKHSVTINGNKVAEVEDGSTYTLGDAQYDTIQMVRFINREPYLQ